MRVEKRAVHIRVDGLVRLEIERDLLFLPLVGQNRADEQHEAVRWHTCVQLQTLLGTRNRSQNRETVDTGLDVGRSTVFLRQHRGNTRDLVLWAKGGSLVSNIVG